MSCINVIVSRICESFNAGVTSILTPLKVIVSAQDTIKATATDISTRLNLSCSIVCGINDKAFLNVSPEEVQWLTDDMVIVYTVDSNTNWEII